MEYLLSAKYPYRVVWSPKYEDISPANSYGKQIIFWCDSQRFFKLKLKICVMCVHTYLRSMILPLEKRGKRKNVTALCFVFPYYSHSCKKLWIHNAHAPCPHTSHGGHVISAGQSLSVVCGVRSSCHAHRCAYQPFLTFTLRTSVSTSMIISKIIF